MLSRGVHPVKRLLAHLKLATCATASLVALSPVVASTESEVTFDPTITELIGYLEAGRRDAAVEKVSSVQTLNGLPRIVTTRGEFVDRMLGCTLTSRKQRGSSPSTPGRPRWILETTDWSCADGPYQVMFSLDEGQPYVTIAEFSDSERIASAKLIRPPLPPMPRLVSSATPEQQAARAAQKELERIAEEAALKRFGQAVKSGSLDPVSEYVGPGTRFTFGWRDPFNSVTILDLDGEGAEAGQAQIAAAKDMMGEPKSASCKFDDLSSMCKWDYRQPGTSLLAFPFFRDGKFISVQFLYTTPESIMKAMEKATPEQVEALRASISESN